MQPASPTTVFSLETAFALELESALLGARSASAVATLAASR